MKKVTLITSLSALAMVMPLSVSLSSCGEAKENNIDVQVIHWRSLNYVYSTRQFAQFCIDVFDFEGGEDFTIKLINQKVDGYSKNVLLFQDSDTDTWHFKIESWEVQKILFIGLSDGKLFDDTHEISFGLQIDIKKPGYKDKQIIIDDLWLEVVRPTIDRNLFTYSDSTEKVITGVNEDKRQDLERCNMFLLPEGVEEIADNAFCTTPMIETKLPANMKWFLLDPSWGEGLATIKKIGKDAFRSAPFEGAIYLPETLEEIGESAFQGVNFRGELSFPNSVKKIGNQAFKLCERLTGPVTLPKNPTELGTAIFSACSRLKGDIVIPAGWKKIPAHTFSACSALDGTLTIPEGITEIGDNAFSTCRKLSGELRLPHTLTKINDSAFWQCESFTGDLVIPNSVEFVGNKAFEGCAGFNGHLTLSNQLKEIGEWGFSDCGSLTGDLTIYYGVNKIGQYAFEGCYKLDGCLTIPKSTYDVNGKAFAECWGISSINITAWNINDVEVVPGMFATFKPEGIVYVDAGTDVDAWNTLLKDPNGFHLPEGWTVQEIE